MIVVFVLIMWIALIVDLLLSFLYLCEIYLYLKEYNASHVFLMSRPFSLYVGGAFILEDILNICGESWKRKSGVRRTLFSIIDIVILTAIFVFYFINFTSSRVDKIVGSVLVLLKFVRSFKVEKLDRFYI